MIIDVRNCQLKYNLKKIEISTRERKLILLLSDNKLHSIAEIRKYIGLVTEIGTRALIRKLNQRLKNEINMTLIFRNGHKYQIRQYIYIS